MKTTCLCLGLLLIVSTACSRFETTSATDQDLASIAAVRAELDAAISARDAGRVAAIFAQDSVYLPPDNREVVGREELRTFLQEASAGSASAPNSRRVASDVKVVGDWAFEWGKVEVIHPLSGSYDRWVDGKYLHVYQRQPGGTWEIARASYNANPPKTARLAAN